MNWQERQYDSGSGGFGGGPGQGGGMRSWLGGMPRAGKTVKYIAIANGIMFLLCQFTGRYESPFYEWLAMHTGLVFEGQVWRLFTFTYIHDQGGLLHVGMNMLGLYFLGTPLERHWGGKRFFLFYTLGGFIAVVMYVVITASGWLSPDARLVGASGGVLAVLGACAVLFPQFRLIFFLFPVPIRTAALILVVLYGFNLLQQGSNAGGDACHLAGLAFGVVWGYRGHIWMHKWDEWRSDIKRGAMESKRQDRLKVEDNADQVLDKVRREGIGSLSRREKEILERATKLQQEEDRRHGL